MLSARFGATKLLVIHFLMSSAMMLYLQARMSASMKAPEGLKDLECQKGNLGARPPIPYITPMDLLQTNKNTGTLKLNLPDGLVFSMMIFAKGNPEDYLQHLIAVQHLISQKGLNTACGMQPKSWKPNRTILLGLRA